MKSAATILFSRRSEAWRDAYSRRRSAARANPAIIRPNRRYEHDFPADICFQVMLYQSLRHLQRTSLMEDNGGAFHDITENIMIRRFPSQTSSQVLTSSTHAGAEVNVP
jgi:hypothetical protein